MQLRSFAYMQTAQQYFGGKYQDQQVKSLELSQEALDKLKDAKKKLKENICSTDKNNSQDSQCSTLEYAINNSLEAIYVQRARLALKTGKSEVFKEIGDELININKRHNGKMWHGFHYAAWGRMIELLEQTKNNAFNKDEARKQAKEIIDLLKKSVKIRPRDNVDHLNLAEAYIYNGDWSLAKRALNNAENNLSEIREGEKDNDFKTLHRCLEDIVKAALDDLTCPVDNLKNKFEQGSSCKEIVETSKESKGTKERFEELMLEAFVIRLKREDSGYNRSICDR